MEITKVKVEIASLSDIMFDRFIDYSTERRPPEQKLYLYGKNELVLPQDNIISFLFGIDPKGCAMAFEGKKGKDYVRMGQSHVNIDEAIIPFMSGKKPVIFKEFDDKIWKHQGSPRVKKGSASIKSEMKERPVLRHPWSLTFHITIIKNNIIDENKLYNWFMLGGMQIAFGTYRPRFGRFTVDKWDTVS